MIILLFIIGLIFGSFFTVIGLRLPKEESIIIPSSNCDTCEHPLKFYELIPVLSYLFQGGKCSSCNKKISILYPIIEILTGVLYALCYYLFARNGFTYEFWAGLIISSVLIIIFVSDFKYKIILDSPLVIGSISILLLKYTYFGFKSASYALLSGVLLFLFLFVIKFVGDRFFKKESLGGGDVKLAIFIGIVLGIQLGLTSLIIASFLALPYAVLSIYVTKEQEIPFGPFLISSLFLVYVLMDTFTNFLKTLF